jgi:transposase-like protein
VESVVEGYGIEKSSVSRQFVAASSNQLRALCERPLEDLHLVVLMIDGIHFGGQVLVVSSGIAESGEKHVLGVWQGATENTTVVTGLLEDLVDRGLDLRRRYLVVIDGSKALRAGVERVFGEQVEVHAGCLFVDLSSVPPLRWRHYGGLRHSHPPGHIGLRHG